MMIIVVIVITIMIMETITIMIIRVAIRKIVFASRFPPRRLALGGLEAWRLEVWRLGGLEALMLGARGKKTPKCALLPRWSTCRELGFLGSLGGPWGVPWGSLGGPWGVPGGSLGGPWGIPGRSLGGPGSPRRVSGGQDDPTWATLGPTWGQLGPTWHHFGANLSPNGQKLIPKLTKDWSKMGQNLESHFCNKFWLIFVWFFIVFWVRKSVIFECFFNDNLSSSNMWKSSKTIEKSMVFDDFPHLGNVTIHATMMQIWYEKMMKFDDQIWIDFGTKNCRKFEQKLT